MMSKSQFISTDQGNICYREAGTGLPIIMLHGQGASKEIFEQQFSSPLADVHRLIAFDLIGCGESDHAKDPQRTYTIAGMSEALHQALDALDIENAILLGWSLGGHIALEMLNQMPEKFSGILLSGVPPLHRGTLSILRGFQSRIDVARALRPEITRQTAERYIELSCDAHVTPELVDCLMHSDGQMRTMMCQSLIYGDGTDQRNLAENCPVPLAVVNGSEDPLVRVGYINSLNYNNLWENRCHMIMGAGHSPFLSAPNVFNMLLHRFATDMAIKGGTKRPELELAKTA